MLLLSRFWCLAIVSLATSTLCSLWLLPSLAQTKSSPFPSSVRSTPAPSIQAQLEFRLQKPGTAAEFAKVQQRHQELESQRDELKFAGNAAAIQRRIQSNAAAIARLESDWDRFFAPSQLTGLDVRWVWMEPGIIPEIQVQFTQEGGQKFATLTRQAARSQRMIGIFWRGRLISAPIVDTVYAEQGILGGRAVISGRVTLHEAQAFIEEFMQPLHRFRVWRQQWGYVNQTGQRVIDYQFAEAGDFSEGLAAVKVDDRYGYVDPRGEWVIPAQFQRAFRFSEGLAAVMQNGKVGYINPEGKLVIPYQFDLPTSAEPFLHFSHGIARVTIAHEQAIQVNGESAVQVSYETRYIDRTGQPIRHPPILTGAAFAEGMAAAQSNQPDTQGLWGYLAPDGRWAIPPQFREAQSFSEGRAAVRLNSDRPNPDRPNPDRTGYIDQDGRLVIPARFEGARPFSEGLAAVRIGDRWGYIDKTGQMVIVPQFDEAKEFSEGLAIVWQRKDNLKLGYIDRSGRYAIPPQFEGAMPFQNGLAAVNFFNNQEFGYINKTGKPVEQFRP